MTLALRYAARSDRGLVRGNNQDSVYAGPRLLAVADGMGGHAAGDVASKVVIAALEHLDEDAPPSDMLQALRAAVFDGSEHLREVIRESPQLEGMGTTLTAVLFAGGRLALCHVGDSRAYLVRDGELSQITHDDTFVQTLIDDGRITQEEANHHPQRSLLLRALNGQDVDPDLSMREARAGDRYLLCSDGLSGVVSEETIATTLQEPDPQSCADRLIELALRSGGPDNITVIVADVIEDDGSGVLIEPVVDGAAGANIGQRAVDPGSAAGRAALADPPPPPPPAAASPPVVAPRNRKRTRRRWWSALLALVVLAGAAVGAYAWVLDHWFVGVDEGTETVAVYRGINASILGFDLYREESDSGIAVADLSQDLRGKVTDGIEVDDEQAAEERVDMLREQSLPVCEEEREEPPLTETPATESPLEPGAPLPPVTGDPLGTTPKSSAPAPSTGASSSGEPASSSGSGRDCREAE
ncbi:PP2C family protein-serine/threonine phosphatase [Trujillonella endophytica]|uniref:Serine/threonine protein phosphatase PstP n=1 Tax=Trujillonella endophytica TaxID=673521 RepID=A0A1H8VC60_9ACTN|nr:PP2C family serine/threonine-protein phosphatase [Trujillella endophytica]SEP12881.1 protein phosphatase [Trujillella endophytica]